jgi:hypothetical protein
MANTAIFRLEGALLGIHLWDLECGAGLTEESKASSSNSNLAKVQNQTWK